MAERNEGLGRKVIWHMVNIPIASLILILMIASAPWFSRSVGIDCNCQYCEFQMWYGSIGWFERLWYNLRAIIQSLA